MGSPLDSRTERTTAKRAERDRELFNDIADRYAKKDILASSRIPRKHRLLCTFSLVPWRPGLRVLEVGCGCGYSADYLQGLYDEYIGVDYAERLIDYARGMNSREHARFDVADINDYDPGGQVDVVLMVGVLHHFDEHEKAFKHIVGLLKPGGWLVVNEPQSGNPMLQLARKIRGIMDRGYSTDQCTFSRQQLRGLFQAYGLRHIRVVPQGVFSTPLAEVPARPAFVFKAVAKSAVLLDKWSEKLLGRLLLPVSWNLIAAGQKRADGE
jgi:2-polyprenyl-3-methyl-5-hydroxy-6-metoxy-1,4-benzoquinol methylase